MARFGPFFGLISVDATVTDGPTAPGDRTVPWWPLSALVDDPGLLPGRIAAVHAALAGPGAERVPAPVRRRIAVSVTQLGLTARLAAVALAAATDGLGVPAPAQLVFQDRLGGPYPLGVVVPRRFADADPAAAPWPAAVLDLVRPVTAATIASHGLSPHTAWGNVGSGLAGAARMIAVQQPALRSRAVDLVRTALTVPELQPAGDLERSGRLRRHSCCLIYRLSADAALCGDCVLARARPGSGARAGATP